MKHKDRPTEIWNAHSLYTTKLTTEFAHINRFLGQNPYEIVIVDLSGGWYGMNPSLWTKLNKEIDRYVEKIFLSSEPNNRKRVLKTKIKFFF